MLLQQAKTDNVPNQTSLFESNPPAKKNIVNVASVKQLSPFRYPGGKTWLVPTVLAWLKSQPKKPGEFIEVFAGGGIIGLTVALESLADHVTMIELDPDVAAVWHTILSNDWEWLAKQIIKFELNVSNAQKALEKQPNSIREHAFQTILRNRINHGGILAPGSGILKNGENGKGIASRWYPETLAKRIRLIGTFRERISFIEGDGIQYMRDTSDREDITYFIDPPYTAPGKRAGSRLYRFFALDHEDLFNITNLVRGNFMMTYDDAESVYDMAEKRGFHVTRIPMKGTHHNEVFELIITPT
jgi:DNA adenine methylase